MCKVIQSHLFCLLTLLCVRWNVYHILAAHNSAPYLKLLDHIIKKLPVDVSARMMMQQSKKALNTVSARTRDLTHQISVLTIACDSLSTSLSRNVASRLSSTF